MEVLAVLLELTLLVTQAATIVGIFPFQNTTLSFETRTKDLVSRLTLEEKVAQMSRGGASRNSPTLPIARLGIKPYQWGTECLRGDVQAGNATAFPQALGLAATFDEDLIFRVAEATSIEVRAKNNKYLSEHDYQFHHGISCWSPVINIMRDPRWGRNQETYGEDPYLSGQLAQAFVRGLQGNNTRYFRTIAGCKHYAAYAGPENLPVLRYGFNAVVSDVDLHTTFLPAFQSCVEAGSFSIMCSYNAVNGVPACANTHLNNKILRDKWKFPGYVVSDEFALEFIVIAHNYSADFLHASAAAINGGCDLEDSIFAENVFTNLDEAVKLGLVMEEAIDTSLYRLFMARMRLGEFDPPEMNPYRQLNMSVVASPEHCRLAEEAAVKSFVLLKNDKNLLPLKNEESVKIAVVGPFSDRADLVYGDYPPDALFTITPYEGIRSASKGKVVMEEGCIGPQCPALNKFMVDFTVQQADYIILCLGLSQEIESEARDRADISLPGLQLQLMQFVHSLGKPLVLVLFAAGPVDISWAKEKVPSILLAFYPAQSTGEALASVLFGSASPGGRLPATWPASLQGFPPITNYSMANRTYRYLDSSQSVLYPFGYGLSYTVFKYIAMEVFPQSIKPCQNVTVRVTVTNVGGVTADEVIQVYLKRNGTLPLPHPNVWLVGVKRVTLSPSTTTSITFTITPKSMAIYAEAKSSWMLEPGVLLVSGGGQQPGQDTAAPSNVLHSSFCLLGRATELSVC